MKKLSDIHQKKITPNEQRILKQLQIDINNPDVSELLTLVTRVLNYPSSYEANRHQQANKMGIYDLAKASNLLKQQFQENYNIFENRCKCCQLIIHPQKHNTQNYQQIQKKYGKWNIRTKIDSIKNLGQSTRLFFKNLSFAAYLWLFTFLIYGIFGLITNLIAYNMNKFTCETNKLCGLTMIGLGSKLNLKTVDNLFSKYLYIIEGWIGLVVVFFWFIFFLYKSYRQRIIQFEQDINCVSASDFTVIIENMPEQYSQKVLQKQLSQYAKTQEVKNFIKSYSIISPRLSSSKNLQNINETVPNETNDIVLQQEYQQFFQIYNLNYARSFQEVQDICMKFRSDQKLKEFNLIQSQLKNWILKFNENNGLPLSLQTRKLFYENINFLISQIQGKKKIILQSYFHQLHQFQSEKLKQNQSTRIAFITFKSNYSRIYFDLLNNLSLGKKIRTIFCNYPNRKFTAPKYPNHPLKIERAPEPQDIIWQNIGFSTYQILLRKSCTYILTIILLGLSFECIYEISVFQDKTQNLLISVLISVFLTIFNLFIGLLIQQLSLRERDFTTTYYQTNLAIKTILAQLLNSILLPLAADYYIKKSIYESGGLAQDVIYLSISNAIIPPLMKFIDPMDIYTKLKKFYYNRPSKKLDFQSQHQFNKLWEGYQFEVGFEYVYILKTSIFSAFFLSMQPIISIISSLGLFLMFYAQKYSLLNNCRRPKSSSDLINKAMNKIQYFSIIAYGLGSMTWVYFLPGYQLVGTIIPNIISICIGVLLLIIPVNQILDLIIQRKIPRLNYNQQRMFINNQYSRSNPFTREEAIKDFLEYLFKKKGVAEATFEYLEQFVDKDNSCAENNNELNLIQTLLQLNPATSLRQQISQLNPKKAKRPVSIQLTSNQKNQTNSKNIFNQQYNNHLLMTLFNMVKIKKNNQQQFINSNNNLIDFGKFRFKKNIDPFQVIIRRVQSQVVNSNAVQMTNQNQIKNNPFLDIIDQNLQKKFPKQQNINNQNNQNQNQKNKKDDYFINPLTSQQMIIPSSNQ